MTTLILHLYVFNRTLKQIKLMVCNRRARTPELKYQIAVNNVNKIMQQFSIYVIKENRNNSLKRDSVNNT